MIPLYRITRVRLREPARIVYLADYVPVVLICATVMLIGYFAAVSR